MKYVAYGLRMLTVTVCAISLSCAVRALLVYLFLSRVCFCRTRSRPCRTTRTASEWAGSRGCSGPSTATRSSPSLRLSASAAKSEPPGGLLGVCVYKRHHHTINDVRGKLANWMYCCSTVYSPLGCCAPCFCPNWCKGLKEPRRVDMIVPVVCFPVSRRALHRLLSALVCVRWYFGCQSMVRSHPPICCLFRELDLASICFCRRTSLQGQRC